MFSTSKQTHHKGNYEKILPAKVSEAYLFKAFNNLTGMYMSDTTYDDFTLDWFCLGDMDFEYDEDFGCEIGIHPIESTDGTRKVPPFIVLKKDNLYKVGQLYDYEHKIENNEFVCNELRHPSVIKQNFKLPSNIPVTISFMGPMIGVNVVRIIRAVQAVLTHDAEVEDDAKNALYEYYEEERIKSQRKPVLQLLNFG